MLDNTMLDNLSRVEHDVRGRTGSAGAEARPTHVTQRIRPMRPNNVAQLNVEELNRRINPGTLSYINYVVSYTAGAGETNVVSVSGDSSSVRRSRTPG
jgi:hypothetical protein